MHHFLVSPEQIQERALYLQGTDVNHIKNVLRMKAGDRLTVGSGQGKLFYCRITSIEKDKIWAAIEKEETKTTELPSQIFLFQGLPKSDKMEWIVQKAVELGAAKIIPVTTRRTVVKLDEKKAAAKCARWNAIAESAAKQSGRTMVPEVAEPVTFAQALACAAELDVKVIPYELAQGMQAARSLFGEIIPGQSVAVLIGPEGGFEEDEVRMAEQAGFARVTLGNRILRTETAGLAVLSVLAVLLES